jgi:hypothetical protein
VFFRSVDIISAFEYLTNIVTKDFLDNAVSHLKQMSYDDSIKKAVLSIMFLLTAEWFNFKKQHPLEISNLPKAVRWIVYLVLINSIIIFGQFGYNEFIYFQF